MVLLKIYVNCLICGAIKLLRGLGLLCELLMIGLAINVDYPAGLAIGLAAGLIASNKFNCNPLVSAIIFLVITCVGGLIILWISERKKE